LLLAVLNYRHDIAVLHWIVAVDFGKYGGNEIADLVPLTGYGGLDVGCRHDPISPELEIL
jgi:hypothetical protein